MKMIDASLHGACDKWIKIASELRMFLCETYMSTCVAYAYAMLNQE